MNRLLPRSPLLRYGMAAVTVGLALLLALLVAPLTGELPIELFFTAVILSLWFGRLGPGLLALGAAVLCIDFFFLPPIHSLDFEPRDALRLSIFSLLALLVHFLTDAREHLADRLRQAAAEMDGAARIQSRLLPVPPAVAGFDLGGECRPVLAAGGDYFDFFPFQGGAVGFALGDVSGHDLGPALLAASVRAYLRTLPLVSPDAGEILTVANGFVCEETTDESFITVFLGRLDPATRTLEYAGAGHRGYLLSPSGEVTTLDGVGPPLGVNPSQVYPGGSTLALEEGQLILLLSDGVVEAASRCGARFGLCGVLEVVRARREQTAQEIATALCQAALAFAEPGNQKDDVTAIVIKVR